MVSARQQALLSAGMGFDFDDSVAGLVADHGLTPEDARELMLEAQRDQQDTDIANTHDQIEDKHGN